ncbi:hypothetical protein CFAM422_013253 [Trichoderma lentiforme]|uniref:Uncharacterized protein n=1 Tax=Trichoderma lentiforme TaxID=1567552 RepID=A0A9P4X113_9HYPO|nr:hypothetical protein CFAM422_013253 [Trichoderma lentiforme]
MVVKSGVGAAPAGFRETTLRTRVWLGFLSALAVVFLQGFFHLNGAFAAMSKHAEEGRFSNGKPLYHVYMGYPVVDKMLALSVSFWDPVCHQSRVVKLLSITLSASLQSLGVFALVESLRLGKKHIVLRWCGLNVFCWQYIGAAIFIPLYFVVEVENHFAGKAPDPAVPHGQAKALLLASVLTIIHLYRMVYFPPASITTSQHQAFMAVWQLAPFFCLATLLAISSCFSGSTQSRNADARWIKITCLVYGLLSAVAHIGVHIALSTSHDPSVSQAAAYIPRFDALWRRDTAASVFIEKSIFFL